MGRDPAAGPRACRGIRPGVAEHLAQHAAAVVAALEHACRQAQQQPHLRDRGVRVRLGKRPADRLAQIVEFAGQRPHLVPLDEAFCARERAQALFRLCCQPAAALGAGKRKAQGSGARRSCSACAISSSASRRAPSASSASMLSARRRVAFCTTGGAARVGSADAA